jgi:type II secretory pathway pseudopilin PulG
MVVERRSVQFNEKMRVDGTPFPGLEGLSDDEGMVLKFDDNGNISEVSFEELSTMPHRIELKQMSHPTIVTMDQLQPTRANNKNKRKSIAPATVTSFQRKQQRQAKDRRLQDLLAEADMVYNQASLSTQRTQQSTDLHESGGNMESLNLTLTEKTVNKTPKEDQPEINKLEDEDYTSGEEEEPEETPQFIDPTLYETEDEETKEEEAVTNEESVTENSTNKIMEQEVDQMLEGVKQEVNTQLKQEREQEQVQRIKAPTTWKEVDESPEKEMWIEACRTEMISLMDNETWEVVDLPPGAKARRC